MAAARPGADYNVKILRSLGLYVQDMFGLSTLQRICSAVGLQAELLDGRSYWIAAEQMEGLLDEARKLMKNDAEFRLACTHRLKDAYGPIRFVLKAASPAMLYRQSIEHMDMVARVGRYEITEATRNTFAYRWRSDRIPTRLTCLAQQSQSIILPTIWGLPPAKLTEASCMGLGGSECSIRLTWYDQPHWIKGALGALGGAGASLIAMRFGLIDLGHAALMTSFAGLAAYLREVSLTSIGNQKTDRDLVAALTDTIDQETQARQELLELHASQRQWSRLLEEESNDRSAAIQRLTEDFQKIEENRTQMVRGYSHDLRNPLQVLRLGTGYLRSVLGNDTRADKVLEEIDWSVQQMNQLLTDLNQIAAKPTGRAKLTPQSLVVRDVVDRLRRRLHALSYGKELRVSVFATREAPQTLLMDQLVFDRITDNILTNAVKYTQAGSIIIEVDGTPTSLVIKVSDTGRGIAADELDRTFTPGGSDENKRAANSLGVGLSVVVNLLAQVGGRLEIMSRPNVGTTVWLHFPLEPTTVQEQENKSFESPIALMRKVVSIRRTAN